MPQIYPFTAIVGQERMKRALVLNAVDPRIGGVLIRGERGTAKSTAARALAALLPRVAVVSDCRFGCDPDRPTTWCTDCKERVSKGESLPVELRTTAFVNLPVSATEDRVVGTLDIEKAIQKGERHFEPGVLAAANRGLLYIDEVNLLDDHVVDLLLDSAAMGMNIIEREGISFSHPARFILVGTMNPEEGDLRPQLLDRFGLAVEVAGQPEPAVRAEIVRRRIAYEANPTEFYTRFVESEELLRQRIVAAQALLPQVGLSEGLLELITHICAGSGVDGLRADITIYKTAITLAAWEGRRQVIVEDVRQSAELALLHRRRRQPFEEPGLDQQQLNDLIQQHQQGSRGAREQGGRGEREESSGDDSEGE
jgi:Mg-chelatase subunit ChlI